MPLAPDHGQDIIAGAPVDRCRTGAGIENRIVTIPDVDLGVRENPALDADRIVAGSRVVNRDPLYTRIGLTVPESVDPHGFASRQSPDMPDLVDLCLDTGIFGHFPGPGVAAHVQAQRAVAEPCRQNRLHGIDLRRRRRIDASDSKGHPRAVHGSKQCIHAAAHGDLQLFVADGHTAFDLDADRDADDLETGAALDVEAEQ